MSEAAVQTVLPIIDEPAERQSGVWPAQWIKAAIANRDIVSREDMLAEQIQPASLDLRLGHVVYRVPASFLPGRQTTVADKLHLLSEEKIDIEDGAVLRTGHVYIIPLLESIRLKKRISGIANPKSSTGRLDVFARVITDYGTEFDTIRERYAGPLWLEVAPRSFDVKVRTGSRLAQIRIRSGTPPSNDAFVRRLNQEIELVRGKDGATDIKDGAIALSVDVTGDPMSGLIGYKARKGEAYIDVDKVNYYDPDDFWERIYKPKGRGIVLETDDFHILGTKETVAIPAHVAADMVAYDTLVGEFRVHYAGFFDPGFGYDQSGAIGTQVVLEVRSHEVPFMVEDGQLVGRLMVERLTEQTEKQYGIGIGSSYQRQNVSLSKQFRR